MKIKEKSSSGNLARDLGDTTRIESFEKEDRKTVFSDLIYVTCELQLLFAFVSIFVLLILPGWLNNKVKLFLAGYSTSMNTEWITVACNILLAGFVIYILIRVFWLFLVINSGDESNSRRHFATATEHFAELIFSVCMIILIGVLIVSLVQFLSILLKNTVSGKLKGYTGTDY